MSTGTKPTILWIHGCWHTPKHFQPIIEKFKQAGYDSVCPRQPSVGSDPPLGMKEDTQCIRDEVGRLVEKEGKDVVVIAHSYGGMLANEAIGPDFSKQSRAEAGKQGGVIRIIFIAAWILPKGTSQADVLGGGGELPPFILHDEKGMCWMADPRHLFYHDLDATEQDRWVAELLKSPLSIAAEPVTRVCYETHPLTFVHCTQDQGNTYEIQKMMVRSISEQYGVTFNIETIESSHSPYLSKPDELLAAVERQIALTHDA